jgi:hypothetical protein
MHACSDSLTASVLLHLYCKTTQYSHLLEPLRPTDKPSARRLSELLACHERFCEQQLANTKTARVLEVAFDPQFTQDYMTKVCTHNYV